MASALYRLIEYGENTGNVERYVIEWWYANRWRKHPRMRMKEQRYSDRSIAKALNRMRARRVLWSWHYTHGIEVIRQNKWGKLLRLAPVPRYGEYWQD